MALPLSLPEQKAILDLFGEKTLQFTNNMTPVCPFVRNEERTDNLGGHGAFYKCKLGDFLTPEEIEKFDNEVKMSAKRYNITVKPTGSTADMTFEIGLFFVPSDSILVLHPHFLLEHPSYTPYGGPFDEINLHKAFELPASTYRIDANNALEVVASLKKLFTTDLVVFRNSFYGNYVDFFWGQSRNRFLSAANADETHFWLKTRFPHMIAD